MEEIPCGRSECVFRAVEEMIKRMKEEIAKQKKIDPEQIVVAEIYNINASTLAEACRRNFKIDSENCAARSKKTQVTMDAFIFLNTLKEDGLITEEYKNKLFNFLIEMNPELKEKVEKDRKLGFI